MEGNYVIFTSSKNKIYGVSGYSGFSGFSGFSGAPLSETGNHYWVIMDTPIKKVQDLMTNFDWTQYSDNDYNNVCLSENKFLLRGTYENWDRKPSFLERVGDLSPNFTQMIKKIEDYYNDIGLELSSIIYETPELIKTYKRMKKLERIINYEKNKFYEKI